jgi:hypothetical protein
VDALGLDILQPGCYNPATVALITIACLGLAWHAMFCSLQEAPFSHDKFTTVTALEFVEETKAVRSNV